MHNVRAPTFERLTGFSVREPFPDAAGAAGEAVTTVDWRRRRLARWMEVIHWKKKSFPPNAQPPAFPSCRPNGYPVPPDHPPLRRRCPPTMDWACLPPWLLRAHASPLAQVAGHEE
jgi:hypothetical protein